MILLQVSRIILANIAIIFSHIYSSLFLLGYYNIEDLLVSAIIGNFISSQHCICASVRLLMDNVWFIPHQWPQTKDGPQILHQKVTSQLLLPIPIPISKYPTTHPQFGSLQFNLFHDALAMENAESIKSA